MYFIFWGAFMESGKRLISGVFSAVLALGGVSCSAVKKDKSWSSELRSWSTQKKMCVGIGSVIGAVGFMKLNGVLCRYFEMRKCLSCLFGKVVSFYGEERGKKFISRFRKYLEPCLLEFNVSKTETSGKVILKGKFKFAFEDVSGKKFSQFGNCEVSYDPGEGNMKSAIREFIYGVFMEVFGEDDVLRSCGEGFLKDFAGYLALKYEDKVSLKSIE